MGVILILIAIALIICVAEWRGEGKWEDVASAMTVCSILILIIITIATGASYKTYLDTRAFYSATVEQYRGAVTMYEDAAALDIKKAALTDFVYQGYQENVSGMILDLRRAVAEYNTKLVAKRIMDENFMFSWLIIAPDKDMKILRLVEREEE
jgi:type IV secretory pathway TraG/TraD family ATPase VirD4